MPQAKRAGSHHLLETVFIYERSYLTGGGRGETTGSDGNERGAHTSGTRGRRTLTTMATKNQNGIKKRKRRPTTGRARAASKTIATQSKATSRSAE